MAESNELLNQQDCTLSFCYRDFEKYAIIVFVSFAMISILMFPIRQFNVLILFWNENEKERRSIQRYASKMISFI